MLQNHKDINNEVCKCIVTVRIHQQSMQFQIYSEVVCHQGHRNMGCVYKNMSMIPAITDIGLGMEIKTNNCNKKKANKIEVLYDPPIKFLFIGY